MARPGITYEAVAEAASELLGQNINPTIEQVRKILGTGSSTTIANHLRGWKEVQSNSSLLAAKDDLPEELVSMLKGLWERMLHQSQDRINAIEASYQALLVESRNVADKYRHNNHRWQKLFNQWHKEKEKMDAVRDGLEKKLEAMQHDYNALNTKYETAVQRLNEKQVRIDELHVLHRQAQTNLEQDRQVAREQMHTERDAFQEQQNKLQAKIDNLIAKLDAVMQKNMTLQQQLQMEKQAQDNILMQLKGTEKQLHESEKDRTLLAKSNYQWQQKYTDLSEMAAEKTALYVEAQAEIKQLNKQLTTTTQSLEKLSNENNRLLEVKSVLTYEKSLLQGQLKQLESATS